MPSDVTPTVSDKLDGYENQSGLHALLEAICTELRTQALIAAKGVRVLPEYHADLMNNLVAVLNKRLGLLINVGFSTADADHDSMSAMLRTVKIEVDVYENVLFNQSAQGTKTSALSFAEATLSCLHQWLPTATETLINPQTVRMAKSGTLQMNREKTDLKAGLVCYTTRFVTGACITCHCAA